MNLGSTIFLRGVVILLGLIVLGLCIALPFFLALEDAPGIHRYIPLALYIPAIPFFVAIFQALRLLNYIDTNRAFSDLSVQALKKIKYCAASISVFFTAIFPYFYISGQNDDSPGVLLIGPIIIFASLAISVFAATLQKLLKSAVDMKAEHDLTV